jgi:prepilin-type N-terminal cleavage/methylation domain-containing protein
MKKFRSAFSLIEISIVILVIGLIVAGIAQANRLVNRSAMTSAQAQTNSSPVPLIDGLVYWIETTAEKSFLAAEAKDNTAITAWYNANPTANFNIGNTTSVTGTPKYFVKKLNNLPTITFDGSSYFNLPAGTVPYGDSEYSAFFVVKPASATCNCMVLSSGKGTGNVLNSFGFNGSDVFINSWGSDNTTFGSGLSAKFHIYSVIYTSGSSSRTVNSNVDGTAQTADTDNANPRSSTTDNNRLGADSADTAAGIFSGEIAEIVVYARTLKTDEISDVHQYLSKKWRIRLN